MDTSSELKIIFHAYFQQMNSRGWMKNTQLQSTSAEEAN